MLTAGPLRKHATVEPAEHSLRVIGNQRRGLDKDTLARPTVARKCADIGQWV